MRHPALNKPCSTVFTLIQQLLFWLNKITELSFEFINDYARYTFKPVV